MKTQKMMSSGTRKYRNRGFLTAAATLAIIGSAPVAAEATPIVLTASADAEIREDQPETARGAGEPGTTGPVTELSIRVTAGQNRAALIRFDLTGLGTADLNGFADLRLFSRNNALGGTNAGGIKIYGLNPNAPLASTWDEQTVFYRDAGQAVPVSPPNVHPASQPNPGHPSLGDPLPPVFVTNPGTWGSDPTHPNRAPGLRHENPPYSAHAEQENAARYAANQAVREEWLQTQDPSLAYQFYINQPGYMTAVAGANYPDLFEFDVPGSTVGNDLDPALTTFLGYLNYDAKSPARPEGTVFSFTTGLEGSPEHMGPDVWGPNRAALVGFLTNLLDEGHTDVTFLILQKNSIDNDPAPVRSDNLIFASKEFVPPGGNVGDWAPQLVIPEPATLSLLAFAGLTMLRRRK